MKLALKALCCLALAAAPLAAGPVYLPVAFNFTDGAYVRSTGLWVTNPDTAVQGFVVRYLPALTDGTTREDGDETGPYYLLPGQTLLVEGLVPAGFRGMLELDGFVGLQFNGALIVKTLQGVKVHEAEIPVLTQADLAVANDTLVLQGLEKVGSATTSNLGLVNMGHASARCYVGLRQKDGLLIIQNAVVDLAPLAQVEFADVFSILGLAIVPEGARAEITCNQAFWSYFSTYNSTSGTVEFVEPSSSISRSTLVEPLGATAPPPPPPPGNAVVFSSPGTFMTYPNQRWAANNFRINMPFGGSRTFRKIVVDFDFHIGNWDNGNPTGFHCVFWLQAGQSWNNMYGYVNTRGTRNLTVFQVNTTGGGYVETTQGGSPQPGGDYREHYEYDTETHLVSHEIRDSSGNFVAGREYDIAQSIDEFTASSFFIEFGAQLAEGPESYTPGWRFSNLVAQFIP